MRIGIKEFLRRKFEINEFARRLHIRPTVRPLLVIIAGGVALVLDVPAFEFGKSAQRAAQWS
jgi:hypothetical protein